MALLKASMKPMKQAAGDSAIKKRPARAEAAGAADPKVPKVAKAKAKGAPPPAKGAAAPKGKAKAAKAPVGQPLAHPVGLPPAGQPPCKVPRFNEEGEQIFWPT